MSQNDRVITAEEAMGAYVLVPDTVTQDTFSYGVTFRNIPAGGAASGNISVQADSDFLIHNQVQYCGGASDSARVIPNVTVVLTDTGSGRKLMSEALPVDAIFGSAKLPYILPLPKYLFARSVLQVEVVNNSSAVIPVLHLAFNGVKVFNKSNNN